MCLLWGAEDNAGEVPGCAIPGCLKHPPYFPNASALSRYFAKGTRCGPSPAPASITVGRGKTFSSPQKRPRRRTRSAPCGSRGHRGTAGRGGGRETGEVREAKERPGVTPPPVPRSRPAAAACGTHAYGCGTYGRGRDPHRRATGGTQVTRGSPRRAGGRERPQGAGQGRALRPRGNGGVAPLGACALGGKPSP